VTKRTYGFARFRHVGSWVTHFYRKIKIQMRNFTYIAIAAACMGGVVSSQVASGNEIHSACEKEGDIFLGFCIGYITGSLDMTTEVAIMSVARLGGEVSSLDELQSSVAGVLGFCVPESTTNAQVVDVVKKHMTENPATRQLKARQLIVESMVVAFPCK
jgi:hypothetical protein